MSGAVNRRKRQAGQPGTEGARAIVSQRLAEIAKDRTLISIEEAAKLLGLPRTTAYDAAKSGDLPTEKFGRRKLVSIAKLEGILCGSGINR